MPPRTGCAYETPLGTGPTAEARFGLFKRGRILQNKRVKITKDGSSRIVVRSNQNFAAPLRRLPLLLTGIVSWMLAYSCGMPALPEISVQRGETNATLSWPLWAFNYRLESADTSSPGSVWQRWYVPKTVVGDQVVSMLNEPSAGRLYRLAHTGFWETNAVPFLFQFAMFYDGDLELNGASTMHVRGRVHGNSGIFLGSGSSQYFYDDVSTAGAITYSPRYGWSTNGGTIYYFSGRLEGTPRLMLPVMTNGEPNAAREILQIPSPDELIDSPLGRERYYNKAELVIIVSSSDVQVGVKQPFSTNLALIDWRAVTNFVSTNKTFSDHRESFKTVMTTEIDIDRFSAWAATDVTVRRVLGAGIPPNSIYVKDGRQATSTRFPGIRLVNAQVMPSRGLTVATPNPLYTKGHFNQPNPAHLGTTNTSQTQPASLLCDAYTLLSEAFNDSLSGSIYTARVALNTTVVAAIVAGNVPSAATYSGGVNNLPRLLEAWVGKTYTLNGSLVCLYTSAVATNLFQSPGLYYSAPTRNINFDQNLLDITRLPPGTPSLRVVTEPQ